tara:strand:- start:358 stop:657 length:300 start_codon:yes stop_codon:yes gene_type:complete
MKDLDKYLEKAIQNIENDRDVTRRLLDDVIVYLSGDEERHMTVGLTAAKYVETLQRSNEQLVKISSIIQRKQKSTIGLSKDDKNDIFDMIKEQEPPMND